MPWYSFGSDVDYHTFYRGADDSLEGLPALVVAAARAALVPVAIRDRDPGDENDQGAVYPEGDQRDYRQRAIDTRWGR